MSLTWNRPAAATTIPKTPVVAAALTQSAPGAAAIAIDFYIDESDSDYVADTILARFNCELAIVGNKLELSIIPRYWDGNDTYTSATNPANASANNVGQPVKVPVCFDLDAFYTTGGFTRTNPSS